MAVPIVFTKSLAAASSTAIAASQAGSAGVALTLTSASVTIDTKTAANSAIGRQVTISYTGTDTSFKIVGTNSTGNPITDTAVGSSGTAVSNLNFVTVSSITPVGGGLTGVTAGTNGVGASPWIMANWHVAMINVGFAVELVSGAVNFTVQYTYDDPNNLLGGADFPLAFSDPVVAGASANADGSYTNPIAALRVLINSGTGEIRMRVLQSGIG